MRKYALGLLILISIFFTRPYAFADIAIKAEIDKSDITTDETITYKLVITSSEKKIPIPRMPEFQGLKVISQAQSSTFSFLKNGAKTILVRAYILAPVKVGKFKIGPSIIKFRDKTYSSEEFEIQIRQGEAPILPSPREKTPFPYKLDPESEKSKVTI